MKLKINTIFEGKKCLAGRVAGLFAESFSSFRDSKNNKQKILIITHINKAAPFP